MGEMRIWTYGPPPGGSAVARSKREANNLLEDEKLLEWTDDMLVEKYGIYDPVRDGFCEHEGTEEYDFWPDGWEGHWVENTSEDPELYYGTYSEQEELSRKEALELGPLLFFDDVD